MASTCKRYKLGSTNGPRQTKVVWRNDGFLGTSSPTLYCRDSVYAAYAELCGPDDILDALYGAKFKTAQAWQLARQHWQQFLQTPPPRPHPLRHPSKVA